MEELTILRALGALLTYPGAELRAALPEIAVAVERARLLPAADRGRVASLVATLRAGDPLDLEQAYVELFDRGRATSLHLFEHVHGESRDRGQAMVDLMQVYADAGYELTARELPDFLPVVLEYLSCRDLAEAHAMLGDCAHILRDIGEALVRRASSYAAVLAAVLAIAQQPGLDWSRREEAPPPERHFDDDWAETPAFARPDAGNAGAPEVSVLRFEPRAGRKARDATSGEAQ